MKNTALLLNLINRYNNLAYTHNYIFGFQFCGNVYFAHTDADILPAILTVDKASRGQGMALRFCPTKDIKAALMTSATLLCSKEYFEDELERTKYNKGELFEKMVTEYYGKKWHKDTVPFTQDGDLTVGKTAYQIKYERASFTNEKILARLEQA